MLPTPEELDELAGRAWREADWTGRSPWDGFTREFQRGLRAQDALFRELDAAAHGEPKPFPAQPVERPPLQRVDQRAFSDLRAHLYVTELPAGQKVYALAGSPAAGSLSMFGTMAGGTRDAPPNPHGHFRNEEEHAWATLSAMLSLTLILGVLPGQMQGMGGIQPHAGDVATMALTIARDEWDRWGPSAAENVAALQKIALDTYRLTRSDELRKPRLAFSIREGQASHSARDGRATYSLGVEDRAAVFYAREMPTA